MALRHLIATSVILPGYFVISRELEREVEDPFDLFCRCLRLVFLVLGIPCEGV